MQVLNPERGFRLMLEDFPRLEKLPFASKYNVTTCQVYCYLPTDVPLSSSYLASLDVGFARLRAAGVKALFRFAYDYGYNETLNYTWPTVFAHVEQLSPVVQRNVDVVYALQAGFVGAWGEWHDSMNNLEANATALGQLLWAELSLMLPPDRFVQVRSPAHKAAALRAGLQGAGSPLRYGVVDSGSAGGGAVFARTGYHNDGLLSYVAGVTPWPASDGMTWYADVPVGPCGSGVAPLACTADGALQSYDFDLMAHESHWVPTDAEMFPFAGLRTPYIDGHAAAHRARMHHHTTLSVSHGLAALDNPGGRGALAEAIDGWMAQPLNVSRLGDCGGAPGHFPCNLPAPPDYVAVPHSTFEYLRDFLGYRLQLTEATWAVGAAAAAAAAASSSSSAARAEVEVTFSGTIVNWGFAAPVSPRSVRLALVDVHSNSSSSSIVAWSALPGVNAAAWAPHIPHDPLHLPLNHSLAGVLRVQGGALAAAGGGGGSKNFSLGLWLPDERSTSVAWALRLANAPCADPAAVGPECGVHWWLPPVGEGGINLFTAIQL